MSNSMPQYLLKWKNHSSNMLRVFEKLFQTESLTDVTIACEGRSINCHKVVLVAGSLYFQKLLMDTECYHHPIIFLHNIKFLEIKAILEYMYGGEVNVTGDQIAGMLKAAETLRVRGLVAEDNDHLPSDLARSSSHYKSQDQSPPVVEIISSSSSSPSPKNEVAREGIQSESVSLKRKDILIAQRTGKYIPILRRDLGNPAAFSLSNSSQPQCTSLHQKSVKRNERMHGQSPNLSFFSVNSFKDNSNELNDKHRKLPFKTIESGDTFALHSNVIQTVIIIVGPSPAPKPKRYKLYSSNDMKSAIEAVKQGMSALKAARKFNVPSRTVYEKIKNLGLPYSRGSDFLASSQSISLTTAEGISFSSAEEQPNPDAPIRGNNGSSSYRDSSGSETVDSGSGLDLLIKATRCENVLRC